MHGRDGVALDARDAGSGGVEQRIDEVVGQQVDLVDVEDALVRAREQARLERLLALQRATEVERADEPVEARAERQLDERRRPQLDLVVGRHTRPSGASSPGANANAWPRATVTGGSSGASPRTAVDFAVPRSPRTSTPPTSGETALISSALDRLSWPTIAVSGYGPAHAPASSSSPSSAR